MADELAGCISQAIDAWRVDHPDLMVSEIYAAFNEIAEKLDSSVNQIAAEDAVAESHLKVVELPRGDINDIPRLMRNIADEIEAGNRGPIFCGAAVFLDDDGVPTVFGWGRTGDVHSIGLFHIGANLLAAHKTVRG